MPGSVSYGKADLKSWMKFLPKKVRIMDVGCGKGEVRRRCHRVNQRDRWYAIEAWAPYVEKFNLQSKYSGIWIGDVLHYPWPSERFDITIFGDVLEHLEKGDAKWVVKQARKHSKWVAMLIPHTDRQNPTVENPYQEHKHFWSADEVLETWPSAQRIDKRKRDIKGVYILKGIYGKGRR